MKIVFVCWGQENLGVEYVSASLKEKGYQTDLVLDPALFSSFIFNNKFLAKIFDRKKQIIKDILNKQPDILAFSVGSDTYSWALGIASEIKDLDKDIPIVFGGIHPSLVPDKVIKESCVDYVCVGEGEEAICDLAEAIQAKQDTSCIKNIFAKINGETIDNPVRPLADIKALPHPDKEIFNNIWSGFTGDIYWITTSRGCIYNCSFCCHGSLKDVYGCRENFRQRDIDDVLEELKYAKEKYKIRRVCFVDDLFVFEKERALEFLKNYKSEIGLPFAAEIHPQFVDEEIAKMLEEAGCVTLGIGVQTINEDLRQKVLNRPSTNSKLKECLSHLRNTNIFVFAEIIVGLPFQDEKEIFDIIYFFKENPVDFVLPLWLRYYPKTAIIDTALKQDILSEADVLEIEQAKEFKPVSIKGNAATKEMSCLYNILLFSHFMPLRLIKWFEKTKVYRAMPSATFTLLRMISVVNDMVKMVFCRKQRFMYLSFWGNIKFYVHFMFAGRK